MSASSVTEGSALEKIALQPADVPQAIPGYPAAIKAGRWIFSSGQSATDFVHGVASEAELDPKLPGYTREARLESQGAYIFQQFHKILGAAGSSLSDIVRIYQWFYSENIADGWGNIRIGPYVFGSFGRELVSPRPASTGMGVSALPNRGSLVSVDWTAYICDPGETKSAISTDKVPQPVAGYPQALIVGDWLHLPGDLATDWRIDADSGLAAEARAPKNFWYGMDLGEQVAYTMRKQEIVLNEAGCSLQDVVKADIYLASPDDFYGLERTWRQLFPTNPPARSIVVNIGLAARGTRVEIALTAIKPQSKIRRHPVETSRAPRPFGHEPQAFLVGDLLFISSQMATDEGGLVAAARINPDFPYYTASAKRQMETIVSHIAAICEAAGGSLESVVKRQAFYSDLGEFAVSWEVWRSSYATVPAECTVGIPGPLLVPGCTIMVDAIAYIPS